MRPDYTLPAPSVVAGQMGLPLAAVRKLLSMVPGRLRDMTADMRSSLAGEDWDALAKHAHAAKGVCANLRLQPIVDVVLVLERNDREGRAPEDGQALCDDLIAYAAAIEQSLAG